MKLSIPLAIVQVLDRSSEPMRTSDLARDASLLAGVPDASVRTTMARMVDRGDLFRPQRGYYRRATEEEARAAKESRSRSDRDPKIYLDDRTRNAAVERACAALHEIRTIAKSYEEKRHFDLNFYNYIDQVSQAYPDTPEARKTTESLKQNIMAPPGNGDDPSSDSEKTSGNGPRLLPSEED